MQGVSEGRTRSSELQLSWVATSVEDDDEGGGTVDGDAEVA